MGFETVINDATGEVESIKYGDKSYTPQEFERLIDRDKNLQADYTRKMQAVSEKERVIESKAQALEEYQKLEELLEGNPDLQKELDAVMDKFKGGKATGATTAAKMDDLSAKALARVEQLEKKLDEKERESELRKVIADYNKKIHGTLDELNVKSPRLRKAVESDVFDMLMKSKEPVTDEEMKKAITALHEEMKAEFAANASGVPRPRVPGAGGTGGGGINPPKPVPALGTNDFEKHRSDAIARFKQTLGG